MKTETPFVFFGSSRFSVIALETLKARGFLPSLIVTLPDSTVGRNKSTGETLVKTWARENDLDLFQPQSLKESSVTETLSNYPLFVVASYGKIIPLTLLALPKLGALNIHPSLLPKYRGPSPLQQTIIDQVKETGVTIMGMDDGVDHGPIVAKKPLPLSGNETYLELEETLATIGAELLTNILPDWIEGKIKAAPQLHEEATFTKKFSSADGELSAQLIINSGTPEALSEALAKIRALNPEPGTWTILGDVRIKILTVKIEHGKLVPIRVIPAGKKEMSWEDFRRGARL